MLNDEYIFEVIAAPGGKFRVVVNKQVIAEHSCPQVAEAHLERLKEQERQQDIELQDHPRRAQTSVEDLFRGLAEPTP